MAELNRCSIRNCERAVKTRGWCEMHYRRMLRGRQSLHDPPRGICQVKYQMAHHRVSLLWGAASGHSCLHCGSAAKEWAYDGTDPSENEELIDTRYGPRPVRYSSFPEFYMPLCYQCHRNYDIDRHGRRRKSCRLCNRPCHAKGLCGPHYSNVRRKAVLK